MSSFIEGCERAIWSKCKESMFVWYRDFRLTTLSTYAVNVTPVEVKTAVFFPVEAPGRVARSGENGSQDDKVKIPLIFFRRGHLVVRLVDSVHDTLLAADHALDYASLRFHRLV